MKLIEIFILNRALDGEDIFSLPSFSTIYISDMLISDAKDELVEKGILSDHDSFTDEGARLAKRMSDFKLAKKYVQFEGATFGIIENNIGVLLSGSGLGDYDFMAIDISNSVSQMFELFPFLKQDYESGEVEEMEMEFEDLAIKYDIAEGNSLRIKTADNSQGYITDEVFFESGAKLYLYDSNAKMLKTIDSTGIRLLLEERMAADGRGVN